MVLQPAKYTIMFAKMNAAGQSTVAAGRRYGRGRPGSCFRSPARDSGAIAYMSTVAEVTRPTSPAQLGKGRNVRRPMTKQMRIEINGTPRLLMRLIPLGK